MNWGAGIALLYIGFVIGILTLVTMSMNQRVDLVSEDYYDQELRFQGKMEKIQRSQDLSQPISWQVNDKTISIQFPENFQSQTLSGTIALYCPSDPRKDVLFGINADAQNQQIIPLDKVQEGRYLIKLDWKNGEISYWNEGVITIQK